VQKPGKGVMVEKKKKKAEKGPSKGTQGLIGGIRKREELQKNAREKKRRKGDQTH